jgi:hypothetical protein
MDSPLQSSSMAGDYTHSFSTQHDRSSSASDIELRPLVPNAASAAQHAETPERITDLRDATHAAATPNDINEPSWKRIASLQSPVSGLRTEDSSVIKRLVFDSWVCEAIVMALSIGCLAAIALVVNAFDGQAIPQFTAGLTLNTIVSVLSTTARSGMIFVVSASIGQLKWCWLGRPGRRVLDMQAMDDASRGPWGAITMLGSLTGGTLATFGAMITVLMVAFSPFLQQLLAYPLHEVEQQHLFAWAPRNLNYTSFYSREETSVDLFEVLEAGTWSKPKPLAPTCPTSHCEWDSFTSIGWCVKCEDRTGIAVLSDCEIRQDSQNNSMPPASCEVGLGNGDSISLAEVPLFHTSRGEGGVGGGGGERTFVEIATESIWLVGRGVSHLIHEDPVDVEDLEDVEGDEDEDEDEDEDADLTMRQSDQLSPGFVGESQPLLVYGHVRTTLDVDAVLRRTGPVYVVHLEEASQCVLSPCERQVTIETRGSSANATVSSLNYGILFSHNGTACWQPEKGNATFIGVGGDEPLAMTYMDRSRRAFCPVLRYHVDIGEYLVGKAKTMLVRPSGGGVYGSWGKESSSSNTVGKKSTRSLQERLENIATALTNYGLEKTNETVRGRAYAEETYVKVRWWWILLPTLLQLSTLILFITTVVYSHRSGVPIWKSSILAIIYHGVEDFEEKKDIAAERLSGMDAVARRDKVQFSRSADGIHHLYGRSRR